MARKHNSLTDENELHVPKGFSEANSNQGVIKNAIGELEWVAVSTLGGAEGPPGSLQNISVSDIDDPSTELNAANLVTYGRFIYIVQTPAGNDSVTFYRYDDSNAEAENSPYILNTLDGGNTRWIAVGGKYSTGTRQNLDGSRSITSAEALKLAGIDTGATLNDTDANLKNRANHTGTQTASTISDFDTEVSNNTTVAANSAASHSQVHDLAGADHNAATLAQLNAKVSDATLDDSSASRPPSAHTVASHSDTTATGAELNTLTDGSNADALHTHTGGGAISHASTTGQTADDHHTELHSIASHNDTTATGTELNTLTDGSSANGLHNHLDTLPAAITGVITLANNTTYTLVGATNIGTDRIVFGSNSAIRGLDPQNDIITYTGTGDMLTATDVNLIIDNIGVSCANGTLIEATNIDYTINPSVDPFQGRNKRLAITRCNLKGGGNGLGSTIGFTEGFSTVNFNGNLMTNWDTGYAVSNGLSFEALNNKSVLWNDQTSTMITLRDDNWSGQTGGAGSYIPTGFNAFNFNGNILHPRTSGYAATIEEGSNTVLGNVSGNIFITSGITTGGVFGSTSVGYNELQTYNIQGNQGISDNTPTIQATIDQLQDITTTINTINVLEKINFDNTIKTSENLLFSSRILVTSATGFLVDEIITGGTSSFTGKIQSIDTGNNYLYVKYVIDGSSNPEYFTVGETITSSSASTTYNGVDCSFKYYGAKDISARLMCSINLEKVGAGRDVYQLVTVKNTVALVDLATVNYLENGRPQTVTLQSIIPMEQDDILEFYIRNTEDTADADCQGMTLNISGR